MTDMPDLIDRIRSFNRFYTGHLGLLGRSYLDSGMGLTEVRVLHDLAAPRPVRARDLAQALKLDEGQLSRMLAKFEQAGLVTRQVSPRDGRQREIFLTPAGCETVAHLRDLSRREIGATLAGLAAPERQALADALATVERLLTGGTRAEVALRNLEPGDAGWIISRHAELYAQDEGFDASFEPLVAEILAAFLRAHDPKRERGWIADRAGQRLGSIFCVREEDDVAKLRLFFVEKSERGTGLAQHMLDTCLEFARTAGYSTMCLWTHESHHAAVRLYRKNGFSLAESRPVRAFGQDLVEQQWQRRL